MNTDESELALFRAERRVREIQTKLHRWARDDRHRRFDDLFNLVADREAMVKVYGVAMAKSQGHSWAPHLSIGSQ